ncbi:hypothetical protein BVX94_00695, partial [bacterium B17]
MVLTSNRPASLDWQNPATILGILGILTGILFVIIPPAYFWPASVIIGLLLLTATKPFAMLLLTIFFLCIESLNVTILYEGIYEVRIYPYIILGALTFFSCLIQKTRRREAFLSTPITLTMALIVAMESLSIFWSPVPLIALPLIFILICHLMLFVAIINLVDSEERIRIVINTWILTASFISVLVIISQWYEVRWEHLFNSIVSIKAGLHQQANRPAAVGGAINIGGYLALSLMLLMVQILLKKTRKERMPYFFIFILILTALLE